MSRYRSIPVPAGMSFPMMMFSFRPKRWSDLPSMAASVSTRVVSWKEAADSHESVASQTSVDLGVDLGVHPLPGQERSLSRFGHEHPAQHLPDDQLDVLVVDGHTLV